MGNMAKIHIWFNKRTISLINLVTRRCQAGKTQAIPKCQTIRNAILRQKAPEKTRMQGTNPSDSGNTGSAGKSLLTRLFPRYLPFDEQKQVLFLGTGEYGFLHVRRQSMICPTCGTDNRDNTGQCVQCGYRFRVGHAFSDPGRGLFVDFTGQAKLVKYGFVVMLFIILIVIIAASLS